MAPDFLPNVVVWGEKHVRQFCTTALASLLAPGNLPAFAGRHVEFRIATTHEDMERLRDFPQYHRLERLMPVRFSFIPTDHQNKYETMSSGHRAIMREGEIGRTAFIFTMPDWVVGENTLAAVLRYADRGCNALMAPAVRTEQELMQPAVEAHRSDDALVLPHRELTRLILENLHQLIRTLEVTNRNFCNYWPGMLILRRDAAGMLIRCWFAHPVMIRPRHLSPWSSTIDGPFLAACGLAPEEFYMSRTSDDVCIAELTTRDMPAITDAPIRLKHVRDWGARFAPPPHRHVFMQPTFYKARDIDERAWLAEAVPFMRRLNRGA